MFRIHDRLPRSCAVLILVAGLPWQRTAVAEDAANKSPIRVAIFADAGVTKADVPKVRKCLPAKLGFELENITADAIRDGGLDRFAVLIHPGGSASQQAKTLGKDGRERVRRFVKEGGGFIGICAGAYLAAAEYPWALKLLDAQVIDDEHWARGQGEVQLRLSSTGRKALDAGERIVVIHFENGPLLGPAKNGDIPDYESLALFESEIAENGAPTGMMKGTSAIARGQFGDGRVVCFSPHPEKSPGRESFLRETVRWASQPQSGEDERPADKPQSGDRP